MKFINILGYVLVFLPFVGIFVAIYKLDGIKSALQIFGVTIAIVGLISLGVYLSRL